MFIAMDIIIIVIIIGGGLIGFKQGFIRRITSFIGTFALLVIAFRLKDYVAHFFYEYLPFFSFGGILKGVESVNILLYEIVAFIVVFLALQCILKMILVISGLVERILQATIFLSLPSKILGFIVGILEYYIYAFIVLVIISLPIFKLDISSNSKVANFILSNTPVLTTMAQELIDTCSDTYNVINENKDKSAEELNEIIVDMLIDKGLVTKESVEDMVTRRKISMNSTKYAQN